jgi:hypothetical protein
VILRLLDLKMLMAGLVPAIFFVIASEAKQSSPASRFWIASSPRSSQ